MEQASAVLSQHTSDLLEVEEDIGTLDDELRRMSREDDLCNKQILEMQRESIRAYAARSNDHMNMEFMGEQAARMNEEFWREQNLRMIKEFMREQMWSDELRTLETSQRPPAASRERANDE